jgi:hypothetical protein
MHWRVNNDSDTKKVFLKRKIIAQWDNVIVDFSLKNNEQEAFYPIQWEYMMYTTVSECS